MARNESDPLNQRNEGVAAAKKLGLKIVSSEDTYEPGATDFFPVMTKVVAGKPDLIDLSGVAPADAPLLIKAARELGYTGIIATETAQDAKILREVAGEIAKGFIVGGAGASTPEIQSDAMKQFIDEYKKHVGEWNDEAGTKVYALETILATLQKAGKDAISDIEAVSKGDGRLLDSQSLCKHGGVLKYVGEASFGQKRQIGVPMVLMNSRKRLQDAFRRRSRVGILATTAARLIAGGRFLTALIAGGRDMVHEWSKSHQRLRPVGELRGDRARHHADLQHHEPLNFAHGQMFMIGGFAVYYVYGVNGACPSRSGSWSLPSASG